MTIEERAELLAAYHIARAARREKERLAHEWLCEEQRLAHKLWGRPFQEHTYGA